jgi:ComF family protein
MDKPCCRLACNHRGKAESLSNMRCSMLGKTLAAVWSRECFVCGESSGEACVCAACLPLLVRMPVCVCPRCGLPVRVAGVMCGRCQRRPPHFDETRSVFVYTTPVREMVLALKHAHGFHLLDWLADELAVRVPPGTDCLIPAPLHVRRLAERGFNQSCELAARVAARVVASTGPVLLRDTVVRDVDTPKLAGMRARQRRRSVRGIFRCTEEMAGKRVLVIDDVMTSGATLDELARALKQRGAASVTNLVVARTLRLPQR